MIKRFIMLSAVVVAMLGLGAVMLQRMIPLHVAVHGNHLSNKR